MSQLKRPFDLNDFFRLQYINEAALSPDGKRAVYTLLRTDLEQEQEYGELWLLDLDTGKSGLLSAGNWRDSSPAWSPDGEEIAFLSTRGGPPQVYLVRPDGGEARRRTYQPCGCAGPLHWSPDGRWLAFHTLPPAPPDLSAPYRLKRSLYRFDGAGYTDTFVTQIYLLPTQGGEPLALTDDENSYTAVAWSPDSAQLLALCSFEPNSVDPHPNLVTLNLQGEQRTLLPRSWGAISNAAWLPDGRIAFAGVEEHRLVGTKKDLWVTDADGTAIECRTASLDVGIGGQLHDDVPVYWNMNPTPLLASSDGNEVITIVQNGGQVNIYRIALQGVEQVACLADGPRTCFPFGRAGDQILYGVSTLFDPTQLAVLDLPTGQERALTRLNAALLDQIALPELEELHFQGSDGAQVEGWVLKPASGTAPYPAVLHIHGGPHAGYGHAFYFEFLALSGAGYAVIFINHRGSTGYGSKFATDIYGDWGNLDYHDLMAGVDCAIEKGIADPDRLGCCGISGGGNLSCWIVGQTNRFKAAVPENPVTNWTSFTGTSDVGPFFAEKELGGKLHEIPEVYLRCSPILYAHNCTTPTLLIVGEADYRCPAEQAEQFYAVLRANGCTAEMLRLPGCSHGGATFGSLKARQAQNEAQLEWMDRYLKA